MGTFKIVAEFFDCVMWPDIIYGYEPSHMTLLVLIF
jgi:hypothetical protein